MLIEWKQVNKRIESLSSILYSIISIFPIISFGIDDRYRLIDCLKKIMEVYTGTKSRNAVIKRMIEIGLIADRTEVLQKRGRKTGMAEHNFDDNDDDADANDDDDEAEVDENTNQDRRPIKIVNRRKISSKNKTHTEVSTPKPKLTMNILEVQKCMKELTDELRENIEWICESLFDAAEDAEECSEDPDDGVPLVPFSSKQRDAMETETFQKFLLALGLQAPAQNMVNSNLEKPNQ